jgi:hypothetical protein
MTSIELLIEQITLEFKKYLPDWEFPNKEHYVEMYYKELMDSMQKGMEIQQKYNSRKGFRERNNLLNDKTNG